MHVRGGTWEIHADDHGVVNMAVLFGRGRRCTAIMYVGLPISVFADSDTTSPPWDSRYRLGPFALAHHRCQLWRARELLFTGTHLQALWTDFNRAVCPHRTHLPLLTVARFLIRPMIQP